MSDRLQMVQASTVEVEAYVSGDHSFECLAGDHTMNVADGVSLLNFRIVSVLAHYHAEDNNCLR